MNSTCINVCPPDLFVKIPLLDNVLIVVPMIHIVMIPFGIVYGFYQHNIYLIFAKIFSVILYLISFGFQFVVRWDRPYPECVPWFYTDYGFPAPEITSIVSTMTSMTIYSLIYQKLTRLECDVFDLKEAYYKKRLGRTHRRKVRRGRFTTYDVWTPNGCSLYEMAYYLFKFVNGICATVLLILYPWSIYMFGLLTGMQAFVSTVFGVIATIIYSIPVIWIMFKLLKKEKEKTNKMLKSNVKSKFVKFRLV